MSVAPYPLWRSDREPTLLASRDTRDHAAGTLSFPALPDASPLAAHHTTVALAPVGEVYSFTVIHPGAKSGLQPYALGYVDLDGPVRIFGRLQGKARPAIGDRYRAVPDDQFGYVFQAVEGASA